MPQRIQRQRVKGWRMPEGAVYVGRGSDWGNPYVVGAQVMIETPSIFDRVRDGASRAYYCYGPEITPDVAVLLFRVWVADRLEGQIREELADKDLACWCPLDRACHADVLLEIANADRTEDARDRYQEDPEEVDA